jgi:hypothetical protein
LNGGDLVVVVVAYSVYIGSAMVPWSLDLQVLIAGTDCLFER